MLLFRWSPQVPDAAHKVGFATQNLATTWPPRERMTTAWLHLPIGRHATSPKCIQLHQRSLHWQLRQQTDTQQAANQSASLPAKYRFKWLRETAKCMGACGDQHIIALSLVSTSPPNLVLVLPGRILRGTAGSVPQDTAHINNVRYGNISTKLTWVHVHTLPSRLNSALQCSNTNRRGSTP